MASYKIKIVDDNGNTLKNLTVNHPKTDPMPTTAEFNSAASGIQDAYGGAVVQIDLNTDTTVWSRQI